MTNARNNLSVAAFGLETRTPIVKRDHESRGLNATIEVHRSIVCTGSCRADNKVSSLGAVDFFFVKNNMRVNLLDLETEVGKTAALLELVSQRFAAEQDACGMRNAGTMAAGLVALSLDQIQTLMSKFDAVAEDLRKEVAAIGKN